MKQVIISRYGKPDVLKVKNVNDPSPKPNEILIANKFSGVNFSEVMARMNLYPGSPKPPCSLGGECCGIVKSIGKNVKKFKVGQKVMAFSRFQSYASKVCTPENMVLPLPIHFTFEEGAAFPIVYITAFQMLFDLGNLQENQTILIHGAGGGVGVAAIQFAKSINAKIIGTASKWKHPYIQKMGVEHCIDYTNEDVVKQVKNITDNRGVDLIIDPVGSNNWKLSYECLDVMGKLIIYGNQSFVTGLKINPLKAIKELFSMPKYKPMQLMSENKSIMGYHLGRMQGSEYKIKKSFEAMNKFINNRDVIPVIDKIFHYTHASDAHQYMQERKNVGKILIDFSDIE